VKSQGEQPVSGRELCRRPPTCAQGSRGSRKLCRARWQGPGNAPRGSGSAGRFALLGAGGSSRLCRDQRSESIGPARGHASSEESGRLRSGATRTGKPGVAIEQLVATEPCAGPAQTPTTASG